MRRCVGWFAHHGHGRVRVGVVRSSFEVVHSGARDAGIAWAKALTRELVCVIVYLVSEGVCFVTGQTVSVSGGFATS